MLISAKNQQEIKEKHKEEANKLGLDIVRYIKQHTIALYKSRSCGHTFEYQVSSIRFAIKRGTSVTCKVCKNIKLDCLEEKHNILFDRSVTANIKSFVYNDCGHSGTQSINTLDKSLNKCKECNLIDIKNEADKANLELVSIGKLGRNSYKFKCCGSIANYSRSYVKNNSPRCAYCFYIKLVNIAKEYGVEILKRDVNPHYVIGRFISCGHEKKFQIHDFTGKKIHRVVCKKCLDIKHIAEAEKSGIELIGQANNCNPNYRRYKLNCCGFHHDLMITHVRRGSFVCPNCGDSYLNYGSFIYLFKIKYNDTVWLKLGYSKDLDKRFNSYGLPVGSTYELIKSIEIETGREAKTVEKGIHKQLKHIVLNSSQQKMYHTVSGFAECYDIKDEKLIVNILSKLELNYNKENKLE